MTDPGIANGERPPTSSRAIWIDLAGGAVVAAIVVGFLAIVLTSMRW